MPTVPVDGFQLVVLLLFVLPGAVYQFVRSRLRGPTPDDASAVNRVLRALGVSATLVAIYALIWGPELLRLLTSAQGRGDEMAGEIVRPLALWGLGLLVAVPAALAVVTFLLPKTPRPSWLEWARLSYDPTPRAWDFMFTDLGPTYVRALTSDDRYIGGWYGKNSFVSSYPEPREIFLEVAHHMEHDGTFGEEVEGSEGVYIRCDDVRLVELVGQPDPGGEDPAAVRDEDGEDGQGL